MNATSESAVALRMALGRDALLTVDELAVVLRCSASRVADKIAAHHMPPVKAGTARLYYLADVADLFREGRTLPPPSLAVEPRATAAGREYTRRR